MTLLLLIENIAHFVERIHSLRANMTNLIWDSIVGKMLSPVELPRSHTAAHGYVACLGVSPHSENLQPNGVFRQSNHITLWGIRCFFLYSWSKFSFNIEINLIIIHFYKMAGISKCIFSKEEKAVDFPEKGTFQEIKMTDDHCSQKVEGPVV